MVVPAARAVVLVPFPFSDLSQAKLRPAVALAAVGRGDWILCQITSNPYGDARAIMLDTQSFATGSLRVVSYARPGKLFTANRDLIVAEVGILRAQPFTQIVEAVVDILHTALRA
jgi:mRNA interferase MazF